MAHVTTGRMLGSMAPIIIVIIAISQPASAAEASHAAVRIRIHDYTNIRFMALARAQQVVSRMYMSIGVRTQWLESTRPLDEERPPIEFTPNDLTIIVLTPQMASLHPVGDTVVGYAAVTRGEGGRIAFVIYDRVRHVARAADADAMNVMGMVMAHELGHLLLPHQSHSVDGLMRGLWATADFSRLDRLDLRFSSSQVSEIRRTLAPAAPLSQ